MYILSPLKKSVYSAVIFFGTLFILSVGYGALSGGLSTADKVGSGSGLTSTSWNRIVDGVLDLDTRLSHLSFVGGKVGVGTASPSATLDVNGSISSQGPAWEASVSSSFPAVTGGSTIVSGFTTNGAVTVGGWFTPATGVFQPTIAGRYLFTLYAYSPTQGNWAAGITKNNTAWVSGGSVPVTWNGNIANASYVVNLNGSSDSVNFVIINYSGGTVNISSVIATWTKLP